MRVWITKFAFEKAAKCKRLGWMRLQIPALYRPGALVSFRNPRLRSSSDAGATVAIERRFSPLSSSSQFRWVFVSVATWYFNCAVVSVCSASVDRHAVVESSLFVGAMLSRAAHATLSLAECRSRDGKVPAAGNIPGFMVQASSFLNIG